MKKKEFSFSKKFSELEQMTAQLESGSMDLEKSLNIFEKGLKLAEELKQRLGEAENKIKILKKQK